jgi:hypothetical protein
MILSFWADPIFAVSDWPVFGATLLAAIGEFAIVWAIISEVKDGRETNFLQTVFDPAYYATRSQLYSQYVSSEPRLDAEPTRAALWNKSLKFAEISSADPNTRQRCDSQLAHLNQIALLW